MNMSNFRISLDIHDEASQLSFSVKKGDTSRRLYITLTENGMPYLIGKDCYAVFSAVKPDGKIVYNDCIIKDNTIIYDMTAQTTAVSGRCECELILYGGNAEQLTSPRFSVIVYSPIHSGSDIESADEYSALAKLVTEGRSVIDNFAEEISKYSNALKGKASGAIVRVEDVSPITHLVDCRVKSKNIFNGLLDFVKTSETEWSYESESGTLNVKYHYVNKYIQLESGKTYTFSCKSTKTGGNGGGVYLRAYTEDKQRYVLIHYNTQMLSPIVTFTIPKGFPVLRLTFYGDTAASTYEATYTEIMLEEGSEATGFVPWADTATATVMRCGKNLLDLSRATFTSATLNEAVNGITCKINNSYYSGARINYLNDFLLANKGKTLTFSIEEAIEGTMITLLIYGTRTSGKTNQEGSSTGKREISFPISEEFTAITGLEVRVNRKTTAFTDTTTIVRNMQVEVSDSATDFEVFKESATYTPGTMTSISPTMTFLADKGNVLVEVEYNKDSNKVVEDLIDRIIKGDLAKIAPILTSITLYANKWVGAESPYSQVVTVNGATAMSRIDLQLSVEQLAKFHEKDLSFVTENEDGVVTVYAIGDKPTNDYIIQATITEVIV